MTEATPQPIQTQGLPLSVIASRTTAGLATLFCIGWNADVPAWFGLAFLTEQYLATILGLSIASLFLTTRLNGDETDRPPWWDYILAAVGLGTLLYTVFNMTTLLDQIGHRPDILTFIGGVVVIWVMEGLRRSTGWVLFTIISIFIVYALLGHFVPGQLIGRKVELVHLVQYIGFDPSAVFGTPLNVGAAIVILFVFMGKLLFKAGGGEFFTDLALAATGRMRGGSAKISVIASALFGSISGSAVSNVATTGVITIPLMRRGGYSGVNAGAIEAIASTGGQLMPPIMGAAAFLMAEFLEVPYVTIMGAALIPAALYYGSAFIQVDLIAARDNITPVDKDIPKTWDVIKGGWQFAIPLVVLLYALFFQNEEPERAALYAAISVVVVGLIRPYGKSRIGFRSFCSTFWETGLSTMELILIVAAAGFVIGILNISGLGFGLTLFLVTIAGNSLIVILLVAAVICIILGMGMPTSGVYVLLAALVGPAIIEAGADPIAAHMFILYFGMMSMITPPIALAAFAAAALTRAGAMETGFAAMRLGWVAYVVPFLFIIAPTLLMNGEPLDIVWDFIKTGIGVFFISVAIVGYFSRNLTLFHRVGFVIFGGLILSSLGPIPYPNVISVAAIVCGLLFTTLLFMAARKNQVSEKTATTP
ncbi:MAG: TRAP transporter fused permease subunit [Rhodospirillales bacterium]|nr:TRAP transporter fused permease subunit [Rhodospirillales bacterium]